jgi:hypothetical protein
MRVALPGMQAEHAGGSESMTAVLSLENETVEDLAVSIAASPQTPRTWATLPPPPAPRPESEGPFVRAVLKEDGSLEYNIVKTRQRIGAKYLMKEVFE